MHMVDFVIMWLMLLDWLQCYVTVIIRLKDNGFRKSLKQEADSNKIACNIILS